MAEKVDKKRPLTAEQAAVNGRLRAIWERRKVELGLNQDEVAHNLGISQGAFSHYVNGKNAIGVLMMFALANELQVHPYDIDPNFGDKVPKNLRAALEWMATQQVPTAFGAYPAIQKPQPMRLHESPPAPPKAAARKKKAG